MVLATTTSPVFIAVWILLSNNVASIEVFQEDAPDVIVNIQGLGMVRGTVGHTARTDQRILKFYNIRYAQPPRGPLRFKAPVKEDPWKDVRDVSFPGRECPQPVEGLNQNDEDCLSLSVYTKNVTGNYPVMFYIHGGSFYLGGAAEYPPDYLLERDVVLVVIQYRLGPLGFLSTMTETIPGNAGILDMIMALEWVHDHVANFGGNSERVTVFGQSAGAGAVSAMLLSPLVPHDWFNQVILQSGASTSTWLVDSNPLGNTIDIAKCAGCEGNLTLDQIEQCLMGVDVQALINALPMHIANKYATGKLDAIEISGMVVGGPSRFLELPPFDYARLGMVRHDVRMMGGVVAQEGSFMLAELYDGLVSDGLLDDSQLIQYDLLNIVNRILGVDEQTGALSAFEIQSLFDVDALTSGNFTQMINGLIDLAGDVGMKGPVLRDIQTNVKLSAKETYLYTFDYPGEFTRFGFGKDTSHYPFKGGIHHCDDNIYLFPYPAFASNLNAADSEMSETMVDLWTSFAIDGIPKSKNVPTWEPVNSTCMERRCWLRHVRTNLCYFCNIYGGKLQLSLKFNPLPNGWSYNMSAINPRIRRVGAYRH